MRRKSKSWRGLLNLRTNFGTVCPSEPGLRGCVTHAVGEPHTLARKIQSFLTLTHSLKKKKKNLARPTSSPDLMNGSRERPG